jgi:hypothetical protein
MLLPLHRLVRRLRAVAELLEQPGDRLVRGTEAERVPHLGRQRMRALVRPPQRRLRVAPRRRIDEPLQRRKQLRVDDLVRAAPTALATDLHDWLPVAARA